MASSSGLASFWKVALPGVLASFVPAYLFFDLARNRHIFGGEVAPSFADPNWEKETLSKFDSGWEREGGTPVVINPITRGNYHKV